MSGNEYNHTSTGRDFVGHGAYPPKPAWPKNAKVVISFVINYEEGAESCILFGDPNSEHLLSEIIGATPIKSQRNLNIESLYEYGSRAGFYRLHNAFIKRGIPYTSFACGRALEENETVREMMRHPLCEVASHGYRWLDYQNIDEMTERNHIQKSCELHKQWYDQDSIGFYQGKPSINTKRILAESENIFYSNDTYADDLPYYDYSYNRPLLMIPYTLDVNDMRFVTAQGFHTSEQFFQYLKDTFDTLFGEGSEYPKMMSIGLHCRIIGHPGRFPGLTRFFDYLENFDEQIWICQRYEIAKFWYTNFPPKKQI